MEKTLIVGQPVDRVEGRLKVTGAARYSAEIGIPGVVYAVLVTSTIPSGRVEKIDAAAAESSAGVIAVYTHLNMAKLPSGGNAAPGSPADRKLSLLQDDAVHYNGQPVGVVVADTLERATRGAELVKVSYAGEEAPILDLEAQRSKAFPPDSSHGSPDSNQGDVNGGLASAASRVEQT